MQNVAWLAAPYFSMLVICRTPRIARHIALRTHLTLPLGWLAVLALLGALLRFWALPPAAMAACAALSGLAMLVTGAPGDDPPERDADDDLPPEIDWDEFDRVRGRWGRIRRPSPVRPPAGVA